MKALLILVLLVPISVWSSPQFDRERIQVDIEDVLQTLKPVRIGTVYDAPSTKSLDPDDFGIAVTLIDGTTFTGGTVDVEMPMMSISKIFALALAIEQRGLDFVVRQVGQDASGRPFDDLTTYRFSALVNLGAIAVHSYIDDSSSLFDLYSRLAGSPVELREDWAAVPMPVTKATAWIMKGQGRLEGDPIEATEDYLAACVAGVTARQLAHMGAVLANDGVDLETDNRVLGSETVQQVLSTATIAGLYEDSGAWFSATGLPAKSGVSGAVLAIAPGWGAIAAYSPRLDAAGNSVRGALAIKALSRRWNLHTMERLLDD